MELFQKIATMADGLLPEMTDIRRDLHRHAEMGWLEMRTSSIVARKLTDLGYKVLVGEDVCLKDARMGVPDDDAALRLFGQIPGGIADDLRLFTLPFEETFAYTLHGHEADFFPEHSGR